MVIITQRSEFQITGDIEAIRAEWNKESSDKPDETESGVFVGNFYPHIKWKNGYMTLPACKVMLSGNHIGVRFDAGVCFFKDEDEKLYGAIISYINHTARENLKKL